jgi:hypothetical protein
MARRITGRRARAGSAPRARPAAPSAAQSTSKIPAAPMPVPMHMVTMP